MALVHLFLLLSFLLGIAAGPLLLGVAIAALSSSGGRRLGSWTIGLGLNAIYRPAITYNDANELTLKSRSYDEEHNRQYIKFGGLRNTVKRYLHDPMDRFHNFYGTPFGFVDELFGVVVDPRDPMIGHEGRRAQENNAYTSRVETDDELKESVLAAFNVPRGNVGVRLSDSAWLVGGSMDSHLVDYIRKLYEKSQAPKETTTPLRQMLLPIGAFIGVLLIGGWLAGQTGGGGGGGGAPAGNSSTISVGSSLLFLLLSLPSISKPSIPKPSIPKPPRPSGPDINWRDVFVVSGFILAGVGLVGFLMTVFPIPIAFGGTVLPLGAWCAIGIGLGLGLVPFSAFWFCRGGPIGMALGRLYLILGFLAWRRPVITYDEGEYQVLEYTDTEWKIEPEWYRFALTRVGVGLKNKPKNWPNGTTLPAEAVQELVEEAESETPAPTGYVATEEIALEDIHGYLPETVPEDDVFVRTDRTTGWFYEAGQARDLIVTAIRRAKEEFGGGKKPISDTWVMRYTLGSMFAAAVFDWMVFF